MSQLAVLALFAGTLAAQPMCGDCNLDGSDPTILDALNAAQLAAGLRAPTPHEGWACDVDASGSVQILDALALARYSTRLPVTLACGAPGPWPSGQWQLMSPATPAPARTGHAMAFDSLRGVAVLFGGSGSGTPDGTWEWDGTNWTQRFPAQSPPPRSDHAMTFDAARGVTVLFGGQNGWVGRNDTWEWDGTNWTQASPVTSPAARYRHVMEFDATRAEVVMTGGVGASLYLDTWIWDGATWVERLPVTLPICEALFIAYDPGQGGCLLYGIDVFAPIPRDTLTFAWNGTNWTDLGLGLNRTGAVDAAGYFDPTGARLVAVHGESDQWIYAGDPHWVGLSTPSAPASRNGHAMVFDSIRSRGVLHGGTQAPGQPLAETWTLQIF